MCGHGNCLVYQFLNFPKLNTSQGGVARYVVPYGDQYIDSTAGIMIIIKYIIVHTTIAIVNYCNVLKLMFRINFRPTAQRQAILQLLESIYAHVCSLW